VPAFRDLLMDLAGQVAEPALIARHYAHVGRLQWDRLGAGDPDVPVRLKGVFYCLRPAAVLRWMRSHPGRVIPPMRLQTLLEESQAPADIVEATGELVDLKARTRELGTGRFAPVLRAFIAAELTAAHWAETLDRRHDIEHSRAIAARTFAPQSPHSAIWQPPRTPADRRGVRTRDEGKRLGVLDECSAPPRDSWCLQVHAHGRDA
jgi:uncharacterized protein